MFSPSLYSICPTPVSLPLRLVLETQGPQKVADHAQEEHLVFGKDLQGGRGLSE